MATVLPFDPHARRRTTPVTPLRRPADAERAPGDERVIPLPTHRETGRELPRAVPSVRETVVGTAVATEVAVGEPVATVAATEPAPLTEGELAMRFFPVVGAVALLDLGTKVLAVDWLTERTLAVGGPLALRLVYNTASAGGVWLGAHTRELNLTATGVVIGLLVMLVPMLARFDRRAWLALALMAGGGVGNLASLATSDRGVPDFLALRHAGGAWVLNVADVFMFVGLALLARTVLALARAALAERLAQRQAPAAIPAADVIPLR